MTNLDLADSLLARLLEQGVREVVVCPGSYNSPIISLLEGLREKVIIHYYSEERGAAFFALGRIKSLRAPVAVCVTSGTAVAECLPAVVEAHYTCLPLIIISADRPHRFVGTGAPQVIKQLEVLKGFVRLQEDLSLPAHSDDSPLTSDTSHQIPLDGPSHFNLRFEEPLFGDNSDVSLCNKPESWRVGERKFERPLVILSEMRNEWQQSVIDFVKEFGAPVTAEPLSQLRENSELAPFLVSSCDKWIHDLRIDSVIRIGNVPVSGIWRDLERTSSLRTLPAVIVSELPYSGLARERRVYPLDVLSELLNNWVDRSLFLAQARELDRSFHHKTTTLFSKYPNSEPAIIRRLSESIPTGSLVYLGNSLPIREWGDYATFEQAHFTYQANRGANGIDGQIATFAGLVSGQEREYWAVLGDLTFHYDLSSLALFAKSNARVRIVVINNSGGRIFERLPYFHKQFAGELGERFLNAQQVSLEAAAHAFGFEFWRGFNWLSGALSERVVIELVPDNKESSGFYRGI